MRELEFELEDIKNSMNGIVVDEIEGLSFSMKFIEIDDYLYIALLDKEENPLTHFRKVVPNVDFFSFNPTKTDFKKKLVFIKVNEKALERDKITSDNICIDYKLFLFEESDING